MPAEVELAIHASAEPVLRPLRADIDRIRDPADLAHAAPVGIAVVEAALAAGILVDEVIGMGPTDLARLVPQQDPAALTAQPDDLFALLHGQQNRESGSRTVAKVQTAVAGGMNPVVLGFVAVIPGVVALVPIAATAVMACGLLRRQKLAVCPPLCTGGMAHPVPVSGRLEHLDAGAMRHLADNLVTGRRAAAQVEIAVLRRVDPQGRRRRRGGEKEG